MIVCLRSASFQYPDDAGGVVVELRRHHDTAARCDNKQFLVTRRLTRLPVIVTKAFGTYREATKKWDLEVRKLTDEGLQRRDSKILGFHEEG